jgi:hypothetical protein
LDAIRNGAHLPELITAQDNNGGLILIEGHSRATAYLMEPPAGEVEAFVASSGSMAGWLWY